MCLKLDLPSYLTSARRVILATNITLLGVYLVLGFCLYAGRVDGYGDDTKFFNPRVSETDLFVQLYTEHTGRLGSILNYNLLRIVTRPFAASPESFPWWLFYALTSFGVVVAPLNLLAAGSALSGNIWKSSVFLLIVIWLIWAANKTTYALVILYAIVASFGLSLWLLSLGIWGMSQPSAAHASWRWWLGMMVLYIYVSLCLEQFLASVPVLFAAFWSLLCLRLRQPLGKWLRILGLWAVMSALGAVIYFTAPGQLKRNALLPGVAVPDWSSLPDRAINWYRLSVNSGYATLFGDGRPFYLVGHTVLFFCVITAFALVSLAYLQARRRNRPSQKLEDVFVLSALSLTFLTAFLASTSHLLVSAEHFPFYGRPYPALLLAIGLGYAALVVIRLAQPALQRDILAAMIGRDWPASGDEEQVRFPAQSANLARVLILMAVFFTITLPNVEPMVQSYQEKVWISQIRRNLYQTILELHRDTGQLNFRLSRCPWMVDAPWGITAYFQWRNYPGLSILQEGLNDSTAILGDKPWTTVQCVTPPLFPWMWDNATVPSAPVRAVFYHTPANRGAWDVDFWIPSHVTRCTLSGVYNPNTAGYNAYQEAFEYRLLFGTGWAGEPVRLMQVERLGWERWSDAAMTIDYVYDGSLSASVPLAALRPDRPDRALVRLTVANLNPDFLNNDITQTSARVECLP